MKLQRIENKIKKLDFSEAYKDLISLNYDFRLENIAKDFKHTSSITMYAFLMFAVSQNENAILHITICNYLYFMDPYINGADQMIKWHALRILERFPENISAISRFVIGIYEGNPDCPFSDAEMERFRAAI